MTEGADHVTTEPEEKDTEAGTVVYTAQLRYKDGRYTLTVTDGVRGIRHVAPVSRKAVDKLPVYLDMLKATRG
ncbi:hypothetical protein [Streptomyces sp. MST-110588]|uniref:hypothetical protein n=1 Tax=Streptomyces sp. MST-110588 TaxID=2833628 RepID=UPI001F5DF4E2|nr:hypothetical protein [Streptomyces sp. MST-110588]UNO43339.1 hypothetical protein KGS77_32455 [Streptomyces sp. MST-110588]